MMETLWIIIVVLIIIILTDLIINQNKNPNEHFGSTCDHNQ